MRRNRIRGAPTPWHLSDDVPRPAVDDAPVRRISSVEESNARYRLLLERGTTGLSVAFDLPTAWARLG